jgi:hypothetical protein
VPKLRKARLHAAGAQSEIPAVLARAVRESATEDVDLDDPHGTPPVYGTYHKRDNTSAQWMYSPSHRETINLLVREFVLT